MNGHGSRGRVEPIRALTMTTSANLHTQQALIILDTAASTITEREGNGPMEACRVSATESKAPPEQANSQKTLAEQAAANTVTESQFPLNFKHHATTNHTATRKIGLEQGKMKQNN